MQALPRSRAETGGWFYDAQRPARRIRVTWHPHDRLAVMSLWDDNTCSATFRLRVEDAAALSQTLVGFLGECVQAETPRGHERLRWIERLRRHFRPVLADVIHLVERRP
jgi:hypothetical protein